MQPYPVTPIDATLEDLTKNAAFIQRLRDEDLQNYNNLPNIYMQGRKVNRLPASSADIISGDRVGDFNYTTNYFYIIINNAGASWRRIALGVW